jgi:hypothetical protein
MVVGYLVAYTNLWNSTDHPGQALATAVLLATQPKGLGKFWTDLSAPIRKLKGGGKLPLGVEGSIELDLAERRRRRFPQSKLRCSRLTKPRNDCYLSSMKHRYLPRRNTSQWRTRYARDWKFASPASRCYSQRPRRRLCGRC